MTFNLKQSRLYSCGFTLLEQLFVLTVIIVLLLGSISVYQRYKFDQQVRQVEANEQRIMQVLQSYYYLHPNFVGEVNFEDLKNAGWTDADYDALKKVPWVTSSSYKAIMSKQSDPRLLLVDITLQKFPSDEVNFLFKRLHADLKIDAYTFEWQKLPEQVVRLESQTGLWIANSRLQQYKNYMIEHAPVKPTESQDE